MRKRDSLGASKLVATWRVDGRSERFEPGGLIAEAKGDATDVRRIIALQYLEYGDVDNK